MLRSGNASVEMINVIAFHLDVLPANKIFYISPARLGPNYVFSLFLKARAPLPGINLSPVIDSSHGQWSGNKP